MPHGTAAAVNASRELEQKLDGPVIYAPDQAVQEAMRTKGGEVYIFNVGPIEHSVEKGSAGRYTVKACDPGEEFSDPIVLPRLVGDSYVVENEMKTHYVTGEFMAQDIIHPTIGANWSFGQNLDEYGVFWTKNVKMIVESEGKKKPVPQKEDLVAARGKMEITFRKLLAMATTIETNGNLNDITPLMRIAATYYGEDRPWNRVYRKLAECPGCGEPVKAGIIKHACGFIFDIDRALLANMITPALYKEITDAREAAEKKKKAAAKQAEK